MNEVLNCIYLAFIGPLELFFEVVFAVAYRVIEDPGFSIIFLSLAMNFLVLPLYRRADAMQEEERDRAARMKPWIDHIHKTFKGDERFMMQQTYYRQVGYKQTDALKGSISLLLEIPFFIAAYHFLSNLTLLQGVSFGPIPDLGAPDALLQVGDISINVLPIIMTLINVVSAAIYLKGFPIKSKIQTYGIAVIFLVLLYASPAGLVFYWTLNNVFSLVKNLFYKLKNPGKVLAVLASITGVALLLAGVFSPAFDSVARRTFAVAGAVALQVPLVMSLLKGKVRLARIPEATPSDDRNFLLGCLFLALLAGFLIPTSVISASPAEFVSKMVYHSPMWYIAGSFSLAFGLFVIWFTVFYRLATPAGKTVFGCIVWVGLGVSVLDYMLFGTNLGTLSAALQFDSAPVSSLREIAANLAAVMALAAVFILIWKKKRVLVRVVSVSMCVAVAAMSAYGFVQLSSALDPVKWAVETRSQEEPHFELSKTGKNVIVLMLDRGIDYFVPYLMNENPQLLEQFDGFTYYPNTTSYGKFTNVGAPGLYGGYEYTPEFMNERSDLPLAEKHDEALKLMPTLFGGNGYDVTVMDPTYAGYMWIPDLSVFDDCPNTKAYITMDGRYTAREFAGIEPGPSFESLPRNLFCYSLFKTSPLALQPLLYDNGRYNSTRTLEDSKSQAREPVQVAMPQEQDGTSKAVGIDEHFNESYGVLQALPEMTRIVDDGRDTFLMMSNDATHEPLLLQEPDYAPAAVVDNTEFDEAHPTRTDADGNVMNLFDGSQDKQIAKYMHYQVNMASYKQIGAWLDYLRENDVYDNTRIIIVSDHGRDLELREDLFVLFDEDVPHSLRPSTDEHWDLMAVNGLLLVKDFNATGFTTDSSFMTNADTPTIAMQGLIDDPVNPFTGNKVDTSVKDGNEAHVLWDIEWDVSTNNGNTFMPGYWFTVRDDVFDVQNWDYLGYY